MSRAHRLRTAPASVLLLWMLVTAAPAVAGPPMATLVSAIDLPFETCRQRVQSVLASEGLGGSRDYGNGWIASNSTLTAAVACIHGGQGSGASVVHIAVASAGEDPVPLRDRLWQRMQGNAPAAQGDRLAVELSGTTALVRWRNTPGNKADWVSVVRLPAGDDTYGSTWAYTDGKRDGELTAANLAPGDYEVRLYYDWPTGQYNVRERLRFTVR